MSSDPISIFGAWLAEAEASEPNDANAMALATTDTAGRPSVRMVLLKGHDGRGFSFHTNFDSRKGSEIRANPNVGLLFHWKSLRRQVRIEGRAIPVTDAEGDSYFATRARGSQIAAWASDQSRPLESREYFERRYADTIARFEGQDVPRPPHWSGLRVVPDRVEFWTDRPHRLHERRLFTLGPEGWSESLLYP